MKALILFFAMASSTAFAFNRESGGRLSSSAVFTYFTSYGTGIDVNSLNIADSFIAASQARGEIVDLQRNQRGREGETYMCVEFNSPELRVQYIHSIAAHILADREQTPVARTSVRAGMDCSSYDNATEQDLRAYLR